MRKRLLAGNHSEQTVVNYVRAVEYLCKYVGKHPQHIEIDDIITNDGKFRIRINRSKGNKDRYTVLSESLLPELRQYFKAYPPPNISL